MYTNMFESTYRVILCCGSRHRSVHKNILLMPAQKVAFKVKIVQVRGLRECGIPPVEENICPVFRMHYTMASSNLKTPP
jgi:hypothetical protein